jgi:hydrogenase maturation protease
MATSVVGVGQRAAGDDGVGLAVLDEIERRVRPGSVELVRLADPVDLLDVLASRERVVLVDAILGSPAGTVVDLDPAEISRSAVQPGSSHGLGVGRAVELARALIPSGAGASLRVVAITIERPSRYVVALSPPVAAAVPRAADRILHLVGV